MGSALAGAVSAKVGGDKVLLCDKDTARAQTVAKSLGAQAGDIATVAAECKYIFLGVKPQMMADMLADIALILSQREDHFVLVSMAGGLSMAQIRQMAGGDYPVIRIMPNTPVSVGSGVILYDCTENVTAEDIEDFKASMAKAGLVDYLPEKLIDAGSALSGSGPAYADMFIEALADGAVACGLPRDKAMVYAAQMLKGAAELMLDSGRHPGELKDAVCSPGGSTICGVRALEQRGFRAACMEAVEAGYKKSKELGK